MGHYGTLMIHRRTAQRRQVPGLGSRVPRVFGSPDDVQFAENLATSVHKA